jgi:hypothetical protein
MRIGALVLAALATAAAGCGSVSITTSATGVTRGPSAIAGARGRPYQLYTHCGIAWARIDGTFWRATKPASDGAGNPPRGWGNPFQNGTLTLMPYDSRIPLARRQYHVQANRENRATVHLFIARSRSLLD